MILALYLDERHKGILNILKRKKKLLNSWKQEKKHNRNRMAHLADRAIKLIENDIKNTTSTCTGASHKDAQPRDV